MQKGNALIKKWLSTVNKVNTLQKVYRLRPWSLGACIKTISTAEVRETYAWKTHLQQRGETAKRVVPKPELSSAPSAGHSRSSGPSKEGICSSDGRGSIHSSIGPIWKRVNSLIYLSPRCYQESHSQSVFESSQLISK